ncbi:GNAT family N-acetyltransferase [Luteimonas terrae]|uniref:Ribosomal protein S18 acetylase RimI-like enzyme n=1 Tax=Luteimonas terrae TaxID=1530191 RepID=A0ABU1XV85_9GAMM|nr:GNAT family N-acetyltransferase [Luteimonas terrae]MDR7192679.1 ribosomal protein S18 acetylase RimI-like enzyme [Luteimonas terrae]
MSTAAPLVSRIATLDDLAAVLDMMRAFYIEDRLCFDDVATPRAVSALLSDPGCGALLLLGADGNDGYMALTRGFSLEQGGHHALLDELYIAPTARGRGLGAQALEIASAQARLWGMAVLRLEVHHHNPRAKALYLRAGFVDGIRDTLALDLGTHS